MFIPIVMVSASRLQCGVWGGENIFGHEKVCAAGLQLGFGSIKSAYCISGPDVGLSCYESSTKLNGLFTNTGFQVMPEGKITCQWAWCFHLLLSVYTNGVVKTERRS